MPFCARRYRSGIDRERDEESHEAEAGGDRLAHDVVVLVADDVVARDPRDGPEAVGDDRADGEKQQPVQPAQEADEVDPLAGDARGRSRRRNQSLGTTPWTPAFSWNQYSKSFSAAGAATAPPWPPFSITAQTTIGARLQAGLRHVLVPVERAPAAPPRLVFLVIERVAG